MLALTNQLSLELNKRPHDTQQQINLHLRTGDRKGIHEVLIVIGETV
jgi:hypothetical protein